MRNFCVSLFKGMSSCCRTDEYSQVYGDGTDRTYMQESDHAQDTINYEDPRNIVIVSKASEPLDILWKNLGKIETQFPFVRFFAALLGLVIIFFISSPAVLLAHL